MQAADDSPKDDRPRRRFGPRFRGPPSERQPTEGELALAGVLAAIRSVHVGSLWGSSWRCVGSRAHLRAIVDPIKPHRANASSLRAAARLARAFADSLILAAEHAERAALNIDAAIALEASGETGKIYE